MKHKKSKTSPWLGFSVFLVDEEIRKDRNYLEGPGIFIDDLFVPSPVSSGGIQVGDILTQINDKQIDSIATFQKILYPTGIGTEVKLVLFRNGERLTKKLTIEERPKGAVTH